MAQRLSVICHLEGVAPELVCARFGVASLDQLQSEHVFGALVFIGKSSK